MGRKPTPRPLHATLPRPAPPPHPLRRWLFDRSISNRDFARLLGVSPGYASELVRGRKRPTLEICDRISDVTEGAITAAHFQQSEFVRSTPTTTVGTLQDG
jgi:transcriptional regulator with XRE-family HTH domain